MFSSYRPATIAGMEANGMEANGIEANGRSIPCVDIYKHSK